MTAEELIEILNYRVHNYGEVACAIGNNVAWYKQTKAIWQLQCALINLLVAIFCVKMRYITIRENLVAPIMPSLSEKTNIVYNSPSEQRHWMLTRYFDPIESTNYTKNKLQ